LENFLVIEIKIQYLHGKCSLKIEINSFCLFNANIFMNPKPLTPVSVLDRRRGGFSLVEVTMAIGIIAVALIPLFALMPAGMSLHLEAIDTTVSSQIIDKITRDLIQTDFEQVRLMETNPPPIRFFDDQGNEVDESATFRLYDVQVKITSANLSGATNVGTLVRVTIDIARNPNADDPATLFAEGGDSGALTNPNASRFFSYVSKND